MDDRAHKREGEERKIWDSELIRINETLKTYSSRAEINAYNKGYGDAIEFLMQSYEILEHYHDSDLINLLDGLD